MATSSLYYERKNAGICVQCGKKKARTGRVKCKECAIKDLERLDRRTCCQCHKKIVLPGHNKCKKCYVPNARAYMWDELRKNYKSYYGQKSTNKN
jgi:hypothetical protein